MKKDGRETNKHVALRKTPPRVIVRGSRGYDRSKAKGAGYDRSLALLNLCRLKPEKVVLHRGGSTMRVNGLDDCCGSKKKKFSLKAREKSALVSSAADIQRRNFSEPN